MEAASMEEDTGADTVPAQLPSSNSISAPGLPSGSRPSIRTVRACEYCRTQKIKCSGQQPCRACQKRALKCLYTATSVRHHNRTRQVVPCQSDIRPRISQTLNFSTSHGNTLLFYKRFQELRAGIGVSNVDTGSFQFYGPSSHFCFLQRIYQKIQKSDNEELLSQKKSSVPPGLVKWGLEKFLFPNVEECNMAEDAGRHVQIPRDMGDAFITYYFEMIHPQIPILSHQEVLSTWDEFWEPPKAGKSVQAKQILYMVLAIGARASDIGGKFSVETLERWAGYFSNQANRLSVMFQEPSLKGIHFLLLKMMYAFQAMCPNDVYLCLGHAARDALTLGINKAQVSDGNNMALHRLRLTFWTVYSNERLSALYTGRPSSFVDDDIDAAFPEDLPSIEHSNPAIYMQPTANLAFVRAMAQLAKIANRVWSGIYSPAGPMSSNSRSIDVSTSECDTALRQTLYDLPRYLHFYDSTAAIGEPWQETQRTLLGLNHYLIEVLIHRPALVSASLFASKGNQNVIDEPPFDAQKSIHSAISAAKSLIDLAYDVIFRRHPAIEKDGGVAFFTISACVTLLFEVLDPDISASYAKETFCFVEKAIKCLDQMAHVGPTTGKTLSMDIMKVAKDTLNCTSTEGGIDKNMIDAFPWLDNILDDFQHNVSSRTDFDQLALFGQAPIEQQGQPPQSAYLDATQAAVVVDLEDTSEKDMGYHYMYHWLEEGFNDTEIPDSLF